MERNSSRQGASIFLIQLGSNCRLPEKDQRPKTGWALTSQAEIDKVLGMIIAIDGIDGAGKGTQCQLLLDVLKKSGKNAQVISFPVYESFFGKMVSEYLNGKYGSLYSIDPKLTALMYAMDRKSFFEKNVFSDDDIVLFDRYVLSNMAHQGVKVEPSKRKEFFAWLRTLEYEVNRIPYPDISIILDVEIANSVKNIAGKQHRTYTDLPFDLHENDAAYLKNTRDLFLELSVMEHAAVIRCDRDGILRDKTEIVTEIADAVRKKCPV